MASLGGYGAIDGSSALGPGATPGRDFIDISNTLVAGDVESFDLWITSGPGSDIRLKVWRLNGSNYDYIGQSQLIDTTSFGTGLEAGITLTTPITVQDGDYIGIYLDYDSGSTNIDVDADTGPTIKYKTGNETTNQATSGFSTLSNFSLCVEAHGTAAATDEVVLSNEPDDLRVFQRDGSGQYDLALNGTYNGTPTAIQYRVVNDGTDTAVTGHDWTNIDASPSASTWSGTISNIPEGGWYNVDIRWSNDTGVTDLGTNKFGVGALVLVVGDSNARNMFETGTTYTQTGVGSQYTGPSNAWAATAASGAREMIDALESVLSVPIGLIKDGIGSTGLTSESATTDDWLETTPGTKPYPATITDTDALGGSVEAIVWINGINDAYQGLVSEANYYDGLGTLLGRLNGALTAGHTHTNIPFLISQTGRDGTGGRDDDGYTDVREAQRTFAIDTAQAYLACVEIDLVATDPHHDEAGYREMGKRIANAYLDILGETAVYPGPTIVNWEGTSATETVITIAHGEGTDFTPTTAINGFRVLDDGTPETISAAVRTNATTITLTHGTVAGTRTVDYGYGQEPATSNLVVDNSTLSLPLVAVKSISELSTGPSIPIAAYHYRYNVGS